MKWLPKIRFSMRTLFVFVTLLCVLLVPLSLRLYQARQQRLVVEWVEGTWGYVLYDLKFDKDGEIDHSTLDEPSDYLMLRSILGRDFFDTVELVAWENSFYYPDDVSPLALLPGLKHIELKNTRVTDLTPLSQLQNLEFINLSDPQMASVGALAQLENLEETLIDLEQQSSLSHLSKLNCTIHLMIHGPSITDLSPLEDVSSIKGLSIVGTQATEFPSLAHMKQLNVLVLEDAPDLVNLPALPESNSLTELYLWGSNIVNLQPLEKQTNLNYLSLKDNHVSDLSFLLKLIKLKTLTLKEPKVTDISPLFQLSNLEFFTFRAMKVPETEFDKLELALPKCIFWENPYKSKLRSQIR